MSNHCDFDHLLPNKWGTKYKIADINLEKRWRWSMPYKDESGIMISIERTSWNATDSSVVMTPRTGPQSNPSYNNTTIFEHIWMSTHDMAFGKWWCDKIFWLSCIFIKRFHSRGKQPCKFNGPKASVYMRKEFNSYRIGLVHKDGRRFVVLEHQ